MADGATTDVVFGPHSRLRLVPSVIAICLAMSVGTFFTAYFDVNGLREPAGYMPAIVFLGFALVFLLVLWRKLVRITLTDEGIVVERLFPVVRRVTFVRYAEIASIEQARLSLRLSLLARDGKVLYVLPDTIEKISGELTPVAESSIPANTGGLLLEIYQLRQEIARRSGLLK